MSLHTLSAHRCRCDVCSDGDGDLNSDDAVQAAENNNDDNDDSAADVADANDHDADSDTDGNTCCCFVDTLCFSGGGTTGVAFAGVLTALAHFQHLDFRQRDTRRIAHFHGCSVGAFFALVAYLGCDVRNSAIHDHMEQYMHCFDRSGSWPTTADFGGFSIKGNGDDVVAFLDNFIQTYTGIRGATLAQLHDWNCHRGSLVVYTTTLETGATRLSHWETPDVRASVAVFASALIPWLFEPRPIKIRGPFGRAFRCVDGAVGGYNYPVTALPAGRQALGVRFAVDVDANGRGWSLANATRVGPYELLQRIVSLAVGGASQRAPFHCGVKSGTLAHEIEVVLSQPSDPLQCRPPFDAKIELFNAGIDAVLRLAISSACPYFMFTCIKTPVSDPSQNFDISCQPATILRTQFGGTSEDSLS